MGGEMAVPVPMLPECFESHPKPVYSIGSKGKPDWISCTMLLDAKLEVTMLGSGAKKQDIIITVSVNFQFDNRSTQ
jgi:hypothetical protein